MQLLVTTSIFESWGTTIMDKLRLWLVLVGLAASSACGAKSYRLPMTAAEVAARRDGDALIAYLSQPAADPIVSNQGGPGPHITVDDAIDRALVDALRRGRIQPPIWRACVDHILASTDRAGRTSLLDKIVRAYIEIVTASAVEYDPKVRARLAALESVYLERAPEIAPRPEVTNELVVKLQTLVNQPGTGPVARRSAGETIAAIELERGRWNHQRVDHAMLDRLTAERNEAVLARFAARLPDLAMRSAAQRRVIRLRIASSPYPELRDDASHVEEIVMQFGKNPISPRLQPPRGARVDLAKLAIGGVLVHQDVRRQTASLANASPGRASDATFGPIALQGALSVDVSGLSRPITVCGSARDLDPSPCLLPGDLAVGGPWVWRDDAGVLHFVERITAQHVVDLARGGPHVTVPISVGGHQLTAIDWPVFFARPDDLVFAPTSSGNDGPALNIEIEQHLSRLIYTIDDGTRVTTAVVEREVAGQFQIVSQGGTKQLAR